MKNIKILFLLLIATTLFINPGCRQEASPQAIPQNIAVTIPEPDEIGLQLELAGKSGLRDIRLHPTGKTWKDVHDLYLSTVKQHGDRLTETFKAEAIDLSMNQFHLTENFGSEALSALEMYVEEMYRSPFVQPDNMFSGLQALSGYWSDEKVKLYALAVRDRSVQVLQHLTENESAYQLLGDETQLKNLERIKIGIKELEGLINDLN